ncbi:hypothetical protein Airi02_010230 [Actinoallomurus iriomotensis]|uniref:Replication initiator protein n=1 Tax=Actinoallomurus iriomotensis TaxID=478107 RepID=A0A9W6VS88_9ACTN|nr:replication initiator [Actinoallomurus iriomotensis]GLY83093.1 hypothetical protein Airi02_010230 [Actinoallomurus iriomotensis]
MARYIAKYATKGAEASGTVDRPVRFANQISHLKISEHARRMIWTCFTLADVPEYQDLRLRQWAHMLGYRGHFSTKSRRYSVTLTQLRQARAEYRVAETCEDETNTGHARTTVQEWHYAGSGLLHGEHFWAKQARSRIQNARRIRREITERERSQEAS